jgi:hypothetical protein
VLTKGEGKAAVGDTRILGWMESYGPKMGDKTMKFG